MQQDARTVLLNLNRETESNCARQRLLFMGQPEKKDCSAAGSVLYGNCAVVCAQDFCGDGEPQTEMPAVLPGSIFAVKAFEDMRFGSVTDSRTVVCHGKQRPAGFL